jgi:serine/threonine protein kinase/formylglycine-generating enzyme required for sulfatase activity/dienelactone hydrolase
MKAGQSIGHYEILEKLGEGGMGVVFKARDTRLGRFAALKVLPPERVQDRERQSRFAQEARSASALNHPNIITIYDIDRAEDVDFIAMEYVPGLTLAQVLPQGGFPIKQVLAYSVQIADALAKAHSAGIIHRDLKPSNIMITPDGVVKILDFGLAKLAGASGSSGGQQPSPLVQSGAPTETNAAALDVVTRPGMILGTIAYMSPEQAEGKRVDERADLFSFGVVLYEMLSGRQPFRRDSTVATLAAILRDAPPPLPDARGDIPRALRQLLRQTLEKNPSVRPASAADIVHQLRGIERSMSKVRSAVATRLRQPMTLAALVTALLLVGGAVGTLVYRNRQHQWARGAGLAQVQRLMKEGKGLAAFDLADEIKRVIPNDPKFLAVWPEVSHIVPIDSEPTGAELYLREIGGAEGPWRHIGRTPLKNVPLPNGYFLFKAVKPGYADGQVVGGTHFGRIDLLLPPPDTVPAGMVLVPGTKLASVAVAALGTVPLPTEHYFIDRFEVSNRDYKQFVDKGGYERREFWKNPIRRDGVEVPWEQAMKLFVDKTGRPGPATWEGGTYPTSQELYPVGGVSWYEAAAFAEFAGKSLPSISHWYWAFDLRLGPFITAASNLEGRGPAPVGSFKGIGAYGTYDMAGNVQEWCWNQSENGTRFILGGAWYNPIYLAYEPTVLPPLDRNSGNGFRCVKYPQPPQDAFLQAKQRSFRDYSVEKPVDDAAFRIIRNAYAYDSKPLDAKLESADDSFADWRMETVTFTAAYPDDRVKALVFVPRSGKPPFQAVVFHPGAGAQGARLPALDSIGRVDFIIRSGRLVIYPLYLGTYGRQGPPIQTELDARNQQVKRCQDLRRSVEYLLNRGDVDPARLAYVGASWGAASAPMMLALEDRFKTAILQDGGLYSAKPELQEMDYFQFLPQVRIPVLMLNGQHDFIFPLEASQNPFFTWLGTPEKDKHHIIYSSAHDIMLRRPEVIGESLGWLDHYLGPVKHPANEGA